MASSNSSPTNVQGSRNYVARGCPDKTGIVDIDLLEKLLAATLTR